MVLDVDLNSPPPVTNRVLEGTSANVNMHHGQFNIQEATLRPINIRLLAAPIDVETIDDDVMISSPRSFIEARNQSRRNHTDTVVLDEDVEVQRGYSVGIAEEPITRLALNSYNKRERNSSSKTLTNCDLYINLEGNPYAKGKDIMNRSPEPQKATPKEPIFSCAVCMGPLVTEMSTICGHIFCKKCIMAAILAQKKCPTCRRDLTMKQIHRIYLPTSSSS
eukprot:TRINITY_DN1516_c0_g4_i1.p1 TRINITY_DN1516_c0_g4~~TRINITY_DN1516_c0_g4_i1.p1  ORF type:complete len:221 (+),score=24.95 TRINITY_DN1516_c0_g4_i1:228-890(+)